MTNRDDGPSTAAASGEDGLRRRDVVTGAGALALTAAVGSTLPLASRSARAQTPGQVGHVTTSDGVSLYYLEAGTGKPILMIPGWSQTAEQFRYQLSGLSDRYRVIAVDLRGHGESDKPEFGYKISRLAKDVHDMIHELDLDEVNILGHSMGSSVIWNYYDMYGPERLSKLLLIDQMPMITSNPAWPEQERIDFGRDLQSAVAVRDDQCAGRPGRGRDHQRLHRQHADQIGAAGREGLDHRAQPAHAARARRDAAL